MDTDDCLIKRFVATGDEAAFSSLVDRHAAMVLGVALRRSACLSTAEDVCQQVFTTLARKAASLEPGNLAGWLHRTAYWEASNAARKAARYHEHLHTMAKQRSTMHSHPPHENASWEAIVAHLDDALARLSAQARQFIVMHYYERKSIREIARQSGCGEAACRKRIQRSIDKLSSLLRKRGLSTTSTALGAMLATHSLCSTSAPAASIAAVALQSVGAANSATIHSSILYTIMTTTSVIKVSAVVVAVAVPLGILWMQNARLRNEVRELTSESIAQTAQPLKPVSILSERSSKQAQAPASSHEETDTGKQDLKNLLASFLSPSGLLGLAESDAKSRAKRELDRIALAIPDLSEDQKEKLVALFEERNITQIQNMADLFQSGALLDRDSMTNEQRKTLAALDPRINQGVDGDRELRAILTHQQYTRFQEVENERRVKQAEFKATNTLESLSNTMDISTEQEDAIFQDLAQAQLAEEPAADEDRDPFDAMRAREEAQEAIIRSHLTEEQLTAYDEQISQDKGRREAMEKMFRSIFSKQDEE